MPLELRNLWSAPGEVSVTTIATVVAICILIRLVLGRLWSWYRLKHIPGPFLNSISIIPMLRMIASGRMSSLQRALGDKYGLLVRVGPNELLFGDADTYRRITGARSDYVKSPWYETARLLPDQHSVVSMADEEQHKVLRAKLASGYSGKEGIDFEVTVDKYVAVLVDLIDSKYLSTPGDYRPMELSYKAQFFALDIITELALSEAFGFLVNDTDMYSFIEINDSYLGVLTTVMEVAWVDRLIRTWPLNKMLPKEVDDYGMGKLMGLMSEIVDERFKPGAEPRNDMMESHIRSGMSRKEILAEMMIKIMAGADSTAMAIKMAILFLTASPPVLAALRSEIDAAVAEGNVSWPIRNAEATRLPYLQAVIKETLRMYPPITGHNYKLVPKGGDTINGYFVPGGTQVTINHVFMLRTKEVFGSDAEIFRPERWVEASESDPARYKEMLKTVDLVFSHGKYYCLGKTLAEIELNKAIATLVSRYDFSIANPLVPLKLMECSFWVGTDFWLRITKRRDSK
ncbi:cytochrome P450 [Thozetella sp. PMI_491]|nr:cytochrome P450 [Thozetella sp. PMI_491]